MSERRTSEITENQENKTLKLGRVLFEKLYDNDEMAFNRFCSTVNSVFSGFFFQGKTLRDKYEQINTFAKETCPDEAITLSHDIMNFVGYGILRDMPGDLKSKLDFDDSNALGQYTDGLVKVLGSMKKREMEAFVRRAIGLVEAAYAKCLNSRDSAIERFDWCDIGLEIEEFRKLAKNIVALKPMAAVYRRELLPSHYTPGDLTEMGIFDSSSVVDNALHAGGLPVDQARGFDLFVDLSRARRGVKDEVWFAGKFLSPEVRESFELDRTVNLTTTKEDDVCDSYLVTSGAPEDRKKNLSDLCLEMYYQFCRPYYRVDGDYVEILGDDSLRDLRESPAEHLPSMKELVDFVRGMFTEEELECFSAHSVEAAGGYHEIEHSDPGFNDVIERLQSSGLIGNQPFLKDILSKLKHILTIKKSHGKPVKYVMIMQPGNSAVVIADHDEDSIDLEVLRKNDVKDGYFFPVAEAILRGDTLQDRESAFLRSLNMKVEQHLKCAPGWLKYCEDLGLDAEEQARMETIFVKRVVDAAVGLMCKGLHPDDKSNKVMFMRGFVQNFRLRDFESNDQSQYMTRRKIGVKDVKPELYEEFERFMPVLVTEVHETRENYFRDSANLASAVVMHDLGICKTEKKAFALARIDGPDVLFDINELAAETGFKSGDRLRSVSRALIGRVEEGCEEIFKRMMKGYNERPVRDFTFYLEVIASFEEGAVPFTVLKKLKALGLGSLRSKTGSDYYLRARSHVVKVIHVALYREAKELEEKFKQPGFGYGEPPRLKDFLVLLKIAKELEIGFSAKCRNAVYRALENIKAHALDLSDDHLYAELFSSTGLSDKAREKIDSAAGENVVRALRDNAKLLDHFRYIWNADSGNDDFVVKVEAFYRNNPELIEKFLNIYLSSDFHTNRGHGSFYIKKLKNAGVFLKSEEVRNVWISRLGDKCSVFIPGEFSSHYNGVASTWAVDPAGKHLARHYDILKAFGILDLVLADSFEIGECGVIEREMAEKLFVAHPALPGIMRRWIHDSWDVYSGRLSYSEKSRRDRVINKLESNLEIFFCLDEKGA